jgi:Leucine-rich repeat (LRR) protein
LWYLSFLLLQPIGGTPGMDDVGAQGIAIRASQLQLLDISNSSIGDAAAIELAARCVSLRSLDVSVTRITDVGVDRICGGLKKLATLDLSLCSVSTAAAANVSKRIPGCVAIRQ